MTDFEWAIICAIKHNPDYRFKGNEAIVARRMSQKGWLRAINFLQYKITSAGDRMFNSANMEKDNK